MSELLGVSVRTAAIKDLDMLSELFDGYRVFYEQASDLSRARRFLRNRLEQRDSVIFVAEFHGRAAGFVQMYPSFSSVSTARIWILNDLYVTEDARREGVARALIDHAVKWGRRQRALRLVLETAVDNEPAKRLYESMGWTRETTFDRYAFDLES